MSEKNFAIEVKNLTKKFNDFVAVDNISFQVKKGEIFAFLGPNGAGKSTTIKNLTTIQEPTSGEIFVNEFNCQTQEEEVRKSFGIIFQDQSLDEDLTAYENLNYHAILYKVKNKEKKILELLEFVGLMDRKDDFVRNFSGGMKRRVEIARGLLHEPKILFLDEPTIGLDVQTKNFLWKHVKKLNKEKNITVFLTTHNMEEAEAVANRVGIIDHGKILIIGTPREIKEKTGAKNLEEAFLKLTGEEIRSERVDQMDRMRRHKPR